MFIIGYLLVALALFGFYQGELVLGAILFITGGYLAEKLFFCLRSLGVCLMVISVAYGAHHGWTPWVLGLIATGFVLGNFGTRHAGHAEGWGFDIDLSDAADGDGGFGAGGGDGGGGGD